MKTSKKAPDKFERFRQRVRLMLRAYSDAPQEGRDQIREWIDEIAAGRELKSRRGKLDGQDIEIASPGLMFQAMFVNDGIDASDPATRAKLNEIVEKARPFRGKLD
jgi:hypothetical protein